MVACALAQCSESMTPASKRKCGEESNGIGRYVPKREDAHSNADSYVSPIALILLVMSDQGSHWWWRCRCFPKAQGNAQFVLYHLLVHVCRLGRGYPQFPNVIESMTFSRIPNPVSGCT
jgi:hypothetical protein